MTRSFVPSRQQPRHPRSDLEDVAVTGPGWSWRVGAGELELESWSWRVPIEGAVIQVNDLKVMTRPFIKLPGCTWKTLLSLGWAGAGELELESWSG